MKKQIRGKLHSENGVSILFGLLIMMVAALVCAIIIAAALTSAKAVKNDYYEEQAYLTISSAAELVKCELDDRKVTIVTVTRDAKGGEGDELIDSTIKINPSTHLEDLLKTGIGDIINKYEKRLDDLTFERKNIGISVSGGELETVLMDFSLHAETDENHEFTSMDMTIRFRMEDSDKHATPYLTLTRKGIVTRSETHHDEDDDSIKRQNVSVEWNSVVDETAETELWSITNKQGDE